MIHESLLQAIGETPVVRLAAFSAETGLEVYAKLESLNPGGSHKARIALGMVRDAEARGILVPGSGQTIIEPSGGNTGIGLAIAGNILGYRVVLVIPDNYSPEKQKVLRLYGAEVVLYDRFTQDREALADRPLDCLVAGIGTGGHITGLGEMLKARWPSLRVFGVEPEQCDLLADRHAPHEIQGLSIGLVPSILNLGVLDGMLKVAKADCLERVRRTMRSDAVSLGLSSAANLVAIASLAGELPRGSRVLTLIYDGVDGYLPHFE